MEGHSAGDRRHRVLPDTEMDVATAVPPLPTGRSLSAGGRFSRLLKISLTLKPGEGGEIESAEPPISSGIAGAMA